MEDAATRGTHPILEYRIESKSSELFWTELQKIHERARKSVLRTSHEGRSGLSTLEEVGVVAALAQLHHNIEQLAAVCTACECGDILLQELLVPCLLHLRHSDLQNRLLLWRQALLHVILHTSQQERPKHLYTVGSHLVKLLDTFASGCVHSIVMNAIQHNVVPSIAACSLRSCSKHLLHTWQLCRRSKLPCDVGNEEGKMSNSGFTIS
jgi:hypothetical protein